MSKRFFVISLIVVFFALSLSGCHYFSAKKEIANADRLVSQLKGAGGDTKVPYEYCSAEKYLEISRIEFNSNDFKAALGFAQRSKSVAEKGLGDVNKK